MIQKRSLLRSAAVFFVFAAVSVFALEVPPLQGPVNDVAGILSEDGKTEIEYFLLNIDGKTQLQIAVLIIHSLKDENLEDYSYRVARTWALGSKERNSGALLLIAIDDKKIRIETGYGIEENLTDARSAQIIRNIIAPEFRRNNYEKGIFDGVQAMAGYALKDESLLKEVKRRSKNGDSEGGFPAMIKAFLFQMLLIFLFSAVLPHKKKRYKKGVFAGRFSSYSGHSDFSDGFSSSGGGGFSGGGGSFGGGGASGGW